MLVKHVRVMLIAAAFGALAITIVATGSAVAKPSATPTIGVSFDLLNQIRKAELKGIKQYAAKKHVKILFSVANNDANQQSQQIQNFISQHVTGVIAIAQNGDQIVSSIRAANRAGIPFATIDRAPGKGGKVVAQVTGNALGDGAKVASYMCSLHKPLDVLLMVGALTDANAIGRRDGFVTAAKSCAKIKVVQQLPTNWDPTMALNGVTNAFQAHPEINAIFDPSDYLLPAVVSALKATQHFYPVGNAKHVALVTIDGDNNGCFALRSKWIDADVATQVGQFGPSAVDAILARSAAAKLVKVPGLTLSQQNFAATHSKVWGCAYGPNGFKK
jgi:ABC-type sugar transport system substrate-binding protein